MNLKKGEFRIFAQKLVKVMFSICLKNSVTMLVSLKKNKVSHSHVKKQISNQNLAHTVSPVSMYLPYLYNIPIQRRRTINFLNNTWENLEKLTYAASLRLIFRPKRGVLPLSLLSKKKRNSLGAAICCCCWWCCTKKSCSTL